MSKYFVATPPLWHTSMLWGAQNPHVVTKLHMTYGIGVLTATHIAGVENTEADKESRLFNDRTKWTLKMEIFAQITTH